MESSTSHGDVAEDFSFADKDVCSTEEIQSKFYNRYIEVESLKITTKNIKCSPLLDNSHSNYFVSVLSDKSVAVVDKQIFKVHSSYKPHEKEVTDIMFSPVDPFIIFTSSLEGKIALWDLRSNKIEKHIDLNQEDNNMPVTSFDIPSHGKLLCAGTELIGTDSFILFWDLRGSKNLGGYFESHSDDVSYVKFNPDNPEVLASAGSDGLINIFDVTQSSEDKALLYSLNTEDIVSSFCWRNENKKSNILAFTDVYSVQLWDTEEGIASHTFSRENIAKALNRNLSYECYPVPISISKFGKNPIILAGSGLEHCDSSCLRTLEINEKNGTLQPHGILVSKDENLSSITQTASFSEDLKDIITIREDGIASLWREKFSSSNEAFKSSKVKKKKKINPY
ncbi:UNVERIFIED_CONTAM: hypothetical protein RMT77_002892 [Armadillidium vulgare]